MSFTPWVGDLWPQKPRGTKSVLWAHPWEICACMRIDLPYGYVMHFHMIVRFL